MRGVLGRKEKDKMIYLILKINLKIPWPVQEVSLVGKFFYHTRMMS